MLYAKKCTQFLLSFLQWNDFRLRCRFRLLRRCVIAVSSVEPFPRHTAAFLATGYRIRFQDCCLSVGNNRDVFLISNGFEDLAWCGMHYGFATMHQRLKFHYARTRWNYNRCSAFTQLSIWLPNMSHLTHKWSIHAHIQWRFYGAAWSYAPRIWCISLGGGF